MSKTSNKERYTQLLEWLQWRGTTKKASKGVQTEQKEFSKADYYKNKR